MRLNYLKIHRLKIIVDTHWCQEWNFKSSLLKISKNKLVTLLSDANVPVRFRAQQRTKYSSLQQTQLLVTGSNSINKLMWLYQLNWIEWPQFWPQPEVSWAYSFNSCSIRFLAHKTALTTKRTLIFPAFSFRSVDLAVQFCFRCNFSFHEKPLESSLTVAWFSRSNNNSLLRIATNDIVLCCIDNSGQKPAFE